MTIEVKAGRIVEEAGQSRIAEDENTLSFKVDGNSTWSRSLLVPGQILFLLARSKGEDGGMLEMVHGQAIDPNTRVPFLAWADKKKWSGLVVGKEEEYRRDFQHEISGEKIGVHVKHT